MRPLIRDVLLMAVATTASRILGLGREAVIANTFGTTAAYDAFLIAFFVPHFLRQLLAEGALSTAFVPIYTKLDVAGDHADRFASNLLSCLLVTFPFVAAAGILLAPAYVPFLASGFAPDKLALAISLTRVVFPFLILVGFSAVFMGILNAHHRFFPASFAPVWFNVGMILGVAVIARWFPSEPIYGLGIGVLLGGTGQLVSQVPSLRRLRFHFHFAVLPLHPGVRELAVRMAPAVLALAAAQINLLVDNKLASHLGDGGISSLQYAMRLFQLPLGVFAVSLATALLPRLSSAHARGQSDRFSRYVNDGIAASLFIMIPATVGLLLVGTDVIRLLFEHGSFSAADTLRTGRVLSYYAIGLLPYGLVYVSNRASYALGRTVVPLIATLASVAVNVSLDLLLVGPLRESGLALATSAAGLVNALTLLWFLRSRLGSAHDLLNRLARIALGTALLAATVWGVRVAVGGSPFLAALIPAFAGMVVYFVYARVAGLWSLLRPENSETK